MTDPEPTEHLIVEHRGGVLRLLLNQPETFNALTEEMLVGLVEQLRFATTSPDVRVVLISGEGPAFSAGADLSGENPQDKYDGESGDAANVVGQTILDCDKPVVCGLNGVAAGVGFSLALACDLIIATESASLTFGFGAIGLMPDGGASLLASAACGRPQAMRLALLSELVSAPDAYSMGLISQVVPDEDYAQELDRTLNRLARLAPLALTATKRAINAATLDLLDQTFARERTGQAMLLRTADAAEGM
ncbi:MAG TPA: enoyl-CoA hydratase-related protein, partial [Marmoricola sp.]|nr:enoyl-CoA hydratase-related protein [Marmoricola sp.]